MSTITDPIRQQAELLAEDNRKAEPELEATYWFPDVKEVRLLHLLNDVPAALDEDPQIHPFYFRASPQDQLPYPTAVALIRPDEFGKLKLPEDWGKWDDGIKLENGR